MKKNNLKIFGRNVVSFIIVLVVIITLFSLVATDSLKEKEEISLAGLSEKINKEEVLRMVVVGGNIEAYISEEDFVTAKTEPGISVYESLVNWGTEESKIRKIDVDFKEEKDWSSVLNLAFLIIPVLFLIFIFYFIFKQAKGGAMQALDFSKAKARVFGEKGSPSSGVTFQDVAGLEEVKEELEEVVDFLKNPSRFLKLGARIPKGVLLTGAPGVGKTLMARAVAGEAKVPFFEISGSEFIELFVGVGSSRVRDLFANAKKKQPCIIYIDELDAIGRSRGAGVGGGHDEREQTLNQILSEMDGFAQDTKIVVLASTNRPDVLDSALLRPGRFDRKIILDLPDKKARQEILKVHTKNKPLVSSVNLKEVAERTPGFSGAEIANLANEAALLSARKRKKKVGQAELLEAIEKVLLGPEKKGYLVNKKEKELSAYHEAGHAIVSSFLPEAEPVQKISIVSRGQAGGYTIKIPLEESRIKRKSEFISEIAVLLGGYTAEKIFFGEVSTGSSNDLDRASRYARKMVKEFGMSPLGPLRFGGERSHVFLGKTMAEERDYSEETASKIDKEVSVFIEQGLKKAEDIIKDKKETLEKVAKTLVEKETLERKEYEKIIKSS
ncbi:MAG: ATP-dependent zinc metalloprotease FtsH [Candidatus Pacebacteria bacterium]|nr:ATP-dependent zinc metalloprotease FtsH [Candidatus Paceibacterota bacterium]